MDFVKDNIAKTREDIRKSVSPDLIIIQSVRALDEVEHCIVSLETCAREWYGWYFPESKDLSKLDRPKTTLGGDFSKEDLAAYKEFFDEFLRLHALAKSLRKYIESRLSIVCPKLSEAAGFIGARLLAHVGSLRKLAMIPSSTIQLLGAEKAFFRHKTTGANSPKYGLIFLHSSVQEAKDKGKAARMLADKIAIAARVDYFRGKK